MLDIYNLSKLFKGETETLAVNNVSLKVPKGKILSLVGPSGCGKTTLLRLIAGLELPLEGIIQINGKEVYNSSKRFFLPPNKRNIGMVFQAYALWPHMNVLENVSFPLKVSKGINGFSQKDIHKKALQILQMVELSGYEKRMPYQLSGGQQQRLALARALIKEPNLLLLDEPLSNLDFELRKHLRLELISLQQKLNLTTIFVTHDLDEAKEVANFIALMEKGKILQISELRKKSTP